jgi:hypothetical protein
MRHSRKLVGYGVPEGSSLADTVDVEPRGLSLLVLARTYLSTFRAQLRTQIQQSGIALYQRGRAGTWMPKAATNDPRRFFPDRHDYQSSVNAEDFVTVGRTDYFVYPSVRPSRDGNDRIDAHP